LTLNVGQAAFSAMADVVQAVSRHLSHRNDLHGRNSLLSTYIQYQVLAYIFFWRFLDFLKVL
jgi:hypothetical protein